jgi:hypothetical protein
MSSTIVISHHIIGWHHGIIHVSRHFVTNRFFLVLFVLIMCSVVHVVILKDVLVV